jgi:hypothetical protein
MITVVGLLVCWLLSPLAGSAPLYTRVPRALVVALLVWGGAGALVALFTAIVSRAMGSAADAGVVATIRTATLAAAAVALAWAGQRDRFRESAWLLYPVLAAGGIKLLIEDLPLSKPATLFVALAAYGLALIAAPRLSHHRPA